jgi:hypothetical protein
VPLESITRREVLLLAIRMAGALEITGTADAGGSAVIDDSILVHPNTDQLKGHNVYILDGAAQGDDRIISAFTPASDRITVVPNWSATTGSSSVYVILKRPWLAQWFIDGIDHAARVAREHGVLVEKVNTELIGQDILMGAGNFVNWSSGSTAAPDGWTLDGNSSIARRTESPKTYLPYQPRVTTDGSNLGSLTMSITNFSAYRGEVVDLRAFVRTNTASRVTVNVTDGVTTQSSDAISASADLNEWRDTEETDGPAVADLVVDDNPTELTVTLLISAGGAVNADFASVRLILKSRSMYEFDLPLGSENTQYKFINGIELGRRDDDFKPLEYLEPRMGRKQPFRIVDREGSRRLWIERGAGRAVAPTWSRRGDQVTQESVPSDYPVRIHGQASPDIITSDDTNVQLNATYLATYAAWHAATIMPLGLANAEGLSGKIGLWESSWRQLLAGMDARPKAGSVRVYDH